MFAVLVCYDHSYSCCPGLSWRFFSHTVCHVHLLFISSSAQEKNLWGSRDSLSCVKFTIQQGLSGIIIFSTPDVFLGRKIEEADSLTRISKCAGESIMYVHVHCLAQEYFTKVYSNVYSSWTFSVFPLRSFYLEHLLRIWDCPGKDTSLLFVCGHEQARAALAYGKPQTMLLHNPREWLQEQVFSL